MRRMYPLHVIFGIPGMNLGSDACAYIRFKDDGYIGWYDYALFEDSLLCGWQGDHYADTNISGDAIVCNSKMTRWYDVTINNGVISDFTPIDAPPPRDPYEDYLSNLIESGHLNSSERAAYVDALNQYMKLRIAQDRS